MHIKLTITARPVFRGRYGSLHRIHSAILAARNDEDVFFVSSIHESELQPKLEEYEPYLEALTGPGIWKIGTRDLVSLNSEAFGGCIYLQTAVWEYLV